MESGVILFSYNGVVRRLAAAVANALASVVVVIVLVQTHGRLPYAGLMLSVWGFGALCCLVASVVLARTSKKAPRIELSVGDDQLRLRESGKPDIKISLRQVQEIRLTARMDDRPAPYDASEADIILNDQRVIPIPAMVIRRFYRARSVATHAGIDLRFVEGPSRLK